VPEEEAPDLPTKKMINVRLNPRLWDRAKAAASERGTTLERWVTEALEAHIARQQGRGLGTPGTSSAAESELAWRVSALEQAVDYLAQAMGAGLPGGPSGQPGGSSTGGPIAAAGSTTAGAPAGS
jgi:hypothetical protein